MNINLSSSSSIQKWLVLPVLCGLAIASAVSQAQTWFAIADPAGDDFGDGRMRYPSQGDYSEGDLDLRALSAEIRGDEVRFTLTLKNPIRSPQSLIDDTTGATLDRIIRAPFYQFNLDLYFNLGEGGQTQTLPGRGVPLSPTAGWHKAVLLTPEPATIQAELIGLLQANYPEQSEANLRQQLGQSVYFVDNPRVQSRQIRFSVPRTFFALPKDVANIGLTAFITPALLSTQKSILGGSKLNLRTGGAGFRAEVVNDELSALGVQNIAVGGSSTAFHVMGATNKDAAPAPAPWPLVDWLWEGAQEATLAARTPLPPIKLSIPSALITANTAPPRAVMPMAVPTPPAPASMPVPPAPTKPTVVAPATLPTLPPVDKKPAPARDNAMGDTRPSAPTHQPNMALPSADIEARLKALKEWRDKGLISDKDYEQGKIELLQRFVR